MSRVPQFADKEEMHINGNVSQQQAMWQACEVLNKLRLPYTVCL